MVQYLVHRAAGLDHALRCNPFPEQVFAGDIAVRHIDIAQMIDQPAIRLLRDALVKAK